MEIANHNLEIWLHHIGAFVMYILEFIGIFIIVIGSARALYALIITKFDVGNPQVKIMLGESLGLALEFKVGAEIIKTLMVQNLQELLVLAFIVVIRVVLSVLLHWEVTEAEKQEAAKSSLEENVDDVNFF